MAPRYRKVFHGIKYNDYQSIATTKCPGTQFDSSEFFARRMEEYKRTLSVPTTRIEESDAQEICGLISNFHHLPFILNELRGHFEGIAEEPERDIDSFYKGHIRFHFCKQSILIKLHKLLKHVNQTINID